MASAIAIVSSAFSALSIGALLFFSHKVLWLLRYRKLQQRLIVQAQRETESLRQQVVPEWDSFSAAAWRVARGPKARGDMASPEAYIDALEEDLAEIAEQCQGQPRALADFFQEAVAQAEPSQQTVLEIADDSLVGSARVQLNLPALGVATPSPPEPSLFRLHIQSRYSFFRRAIVFFAGVADVVYSSSHIAQLSQHAHLSLGTVLRRMSLIFLLVVAIVLEVALDMRKGLEELLRLRVLADASWPHALPPAIQGQLPAILALLLWTLSVAVIYFGTYTVIRRRHRANIAELKRLESGQESRLQALRKKHMVELKSWCSDYGHNLDAALELSVHQVNMMAEHVLLRARKRLASAKLLEHADAICDRIFSELPESSTQLQTALSKHKTTFRHALWPREEEMGAGVKQAQYRHTWQRLQLALNVLRGGEPEPKDVAAYWRELVASVASFPELFDATTQQDLRQAHLRVVEAASEGVGSDLQAFKQAIAELVEQMQHQLKAAVPLLQARIELCNQRIAADAATFEAEVIATRERARLEAMAFEI